jgi:hypothetical protein
MGHHLNAFWQAVGHLCASFLEKVPGPVLVVVAGVVANNHHYFLAPFWKT